MNEEMATAGTGGFSGSATATGPNAGYDPVIKFRKKLKKNKEDNKLVMPGNKLKEHNDGSSKNCKKGEYFCKKDHKCKPIPEGHHVMRDGTLMKGEKHGVNEGIEMKSRLFQYKLNLPEVGETVVYASNPAELRQKLRLLINYRYRGDIKIERIMPGEAGKFFMDKRMNHMRNVKEQADQQMKQQITRQQIGLEKTKSGDKIKQIRKELQKKTASLMKKQRAGGTQQTVDK